MAYFELRPTCASPDYPIYGAEWAGTSDPSWTRTDATSSFSDPNPYYAGMSTTPSSPFDNISPWKDLVVSEDSEAGTLVSIPKFYFKWTRTGDKMKLQISMHQYDGFFVSPAHADRGDGKGERDVVYVGRYHCASDYKSKTGVTPLNTTTDSIARAGIHALGNTIWDFDIAMYWTIAMLYLVEFAHWDISRKIGYGLPCNDSPYYTTGGTDNMPYHTGCMGNKTATADSARSAVQYRHIDNIYGVIRVYLDGFYINKNVEQGACYAIKNPADFGKDMTQYGTLILSSFPINSVSNLLVDMTIPNVSGYEYIAIPSSPASTTHLGGSFNEYICDIANIQKYQLGLTVGQVWSEAFYDAGGLFCFRGSGSNNSPSSVTIAEPETGFRLMKLP